MFNVFMEQMIVTACMFSCLVLSIFLKIFLGTLYRHMIKETDNMAITNNKLLKQCKTKFLNCYELNNGIHNIPVFVDKFINRLSLGHLSFDLIYHLSGQLMLLTVVFAGIGVCQGIAAGHTLGEILPFYIVSFVGLYLYFSVSTVVDIKGKRRMLKVNLVDYLENHLSSRMNLTRRDLEMLYGDMAGQEMQAEEGEGAEKAIPRARRRTVELMPLGGKAAGRRTSRETAREAAQYTAQEAAEEMIQQAMAAGTEETAQRIMQGLGAEVSQRTAQEAQPEAVQRTVPDTARRMAQPSQPGAASSGDAAVTEEELEMLLKEFLTG